MARTSKKTEVKATETAIKSKAEDIKTENKAAENMVAADKATEDTAAQEKPAAARTKKASEKAEPVKAPAKKEAEKSKAGAAKAEVKSSLSVQYGGRELSEEGLVKIAKDIWKNDLKRKAGDLNSVELYLKPEENKVYYVMNKDVAGSFDI